MELLAATHSKVGIASSCRCGSKVPATLVWRLGLLTYCRVQRLVRILGRYRRTWPAQPNDMGSAEIRSAYSELGSQLASRHQARISPS